MKTPIEPGWYVAKGGFLDKDGVPFAGPFSSQPDAFEARHALERELHDHALYISEWTTPAVVLPTEPTLGWTTTQGRATPKLGMFEHFAHRATYRDRVDYFDGGWDMASSVTAFTPAVAVPAAALDELRDAFSNPRVSSNVNSFLTAVDEANRA